jgi:hypothetical protein
LSALVANVFIGVLEKPFHCRFSFSGAISTLARQRGGFIVALIGVHLVFQINVARIEKSKAW